MSSFKDRLEILEHDLKSTPPAFTMSSELPFAIFRYDPYNAEEREWRVRHEINLLATRIQNQTNRTVRILPLSKLFWQSIKESEGVEALIELEKQQGYVNVEEQINQYLTDPDWRPLTDLLVEELNKLKPDTGIVFLTRATVFAPASYRISTLLEQLHGRTRVPAVLFYPGSWTGSLNYMGLRKTDEPLGSYRVKIYGRES